MFSVKELTKMPSEDKAPCGGLSIILCCGALWGYIYFVKRSLLRAAVGKGKGDVTIKWVFHKEEEGYVKQKHEQSSFLNPYMLYSIVDVFYKCLCGNNIEGQFFTILYSSYCNTIPLMFQKCK